MTNYTTRRTTADDTVSAYSMAAITPSDTVGFPSTRGLYVGTGGNATVVTNNGETVTLNNLLAGAVYPFQITRVNSTDLTADDLVALY